MSAPDGKEYCECETCMESEKDCMGLCEDPETACAGCLPDLLADGSDWQFDADQNHGRV